MDRIACVTGGTSGIGRGIAEKLLEDGYIVYALGRTKSHADELESSHKGNSALHIVLGDISDVSFRKTVFQDIEDAHGRLDVLVNCAGVVTSDTRGLMEDLSSWEKTFDVNVFALVGVTQDAYSLLQKGHAPCIVKDPLKKSFKEFLSPV